MRYFPRYEAFLVAFGRGTKWKRKGKGRKEEREEGKKGGKLTQNSGPGLSVIFRKRGYKEWEKGKEGRGGRKRRKGERNEGEKEGERGRRKGGRH